MTMTDTETVSMGTPYRTVTKVLASRATSDGGGVKIRRVAGMQELDPFLMLDEFGSNDPNDYIAGFPEHPHRGFETVTYMLDGYMEHRDSAGNHGKLGPGDVQWMSAGRGIVHSEMPLQDNGLMRGFQLWINLPASDKMNPPRYQEFAATDIPVAQADGVRVKVITGEHGGLEGAVRDIATEPTYLDATLSPGAVLEHALADGHVAVVYLFEGGASVGAPGEAVGLERSSAAVLGGKGMVRIEAAAGEARLLLLAGRPLGEPVVQYGPFVMNTQDEIRQAIADYQTGRLTG